MEDYSFIEILKDIMIDQNLNQSQVARLAGVKPSQVCEWLNGKSKPGYDNLRALTKGLGVSADTLLGIKY